MTKISNITYGLEGVTIDSEVSIGNVTQVHEVVSTAIEEVGQLYSDKKGTVDLKSEIKPYRRSSTEHRTYIRGDVKGDPSKKVTPNQAAFGKALDALVAAGFLDVKMLIGKDAKKPVDSKNPRFSALPFIGPRIEAFKSRDIPRAVQAAMPGQGQGAVRGK